MSCFTHGLKIWLKCPSDNTQEELKELLEAEIKARMEKMPPAARRRFAEELKMIYPLRAVQILEKPDIKELLKATKTNGGMFYETNCQRIVSEEELPSLLVKGWSVAAVLPSGKIVVSNES